MLEYQKSRIHESRLLRAQGLSEEEVRAALAAQELPFRPAFENGKRRPREDDGSPPAMGLSRFRRPG